MSNADQAQILKQGVSAWNEWRNQNPDVRPDLSNADLRGLNVGHYDEDYYHERDDLRYEMEADLRLKMEEEMERGKRKPVSIWEVKEEEIIIEDLRNGFDLRNANLSGAMLNGAYLASADFTSAILEDAVLDDADLRSTSFRDANLYSASLERANLRSADLTRANLTDSFLYDADLSGAKFDETIMTSCVIGSTVFADNDLSTIIGLDQVRHSGPSTIAIDTLYKSKGSIPDGFLRGIGVPETLITFIRSQGPQDFNFPTCFISYAESDDAFSKQLLGDLKSSGVRCWRWKEDAPWGKPLPKSIHEAIQDYDKLILICSKSSLNSPAVIREIERALQKEDALARKGKEGDVLFPIRLDDFIFEWDHHLKADITKKNIGDFRKWHEPENYQRSIERLIKDLRAGAEAT